MKHTIQKQVSQPIEGNFDIKLTPFLSSYITNKVHDHIFNLMSSLVRYQTYLSVESPVEDVQFIISIRI